MNTYYIIISKYTSNRRLRNGYITVIANDMRTAVEFSSKIPDVSRIVPAKSMRFEGLKEIAYYDLSQVESH